MTERFDDLGVTITPPLGWHVRVGEEPRYVALVRDEDRDVEGAWLVGTLSIQRATAGDLDSASTAAMRRYVRQGRSEYARVIIHGRTAHRHLWTDGVRNIATWFIEARDHVLEIHSDADAFRSEIGAELALGAMLMCHVALDTPSRSVPR